jgi:hypothetical protein
MLIMDMLSIAINSLSKTILSFVKITVYMLIVNVLSVSSYHDAEYRYDECRNVLSVVVLIVFRLSIKAFCIRTLSNKTITKVCCYS